MRDDSDTITQYPLILNYGLENDACAEFNLSGRLPVMHF